MDMKRLFAIIVCTACSVIVTAQTYTLEQLKDSARHNNIALRNAQRDIEAAQQQRKEAFTKYFPNVSGTTLWFNANKGMAQTTVNPSEMISPEIGVALAQMYPAEALAALANPISISMMKNGTIAGLTAMQTVFAGGQIINGNRLAKVGEEVSRLQLQLSENEVEKTAEQYFWQLASLQEKTKTIAAVEAFLADIHKDVDVAVRAGVALRNDLLQVELRQNDVESQKLKLQNGISIVKLLLGQYCGLRDTTFSIDHSFIEHSFIEHSPLTIDHSFIEHSPLTIDHSAAPTDAAANVQCSMFNVQWNNVQCSMVNGQWKNVQSLPEYQLLSKQVEAAALQRKMAVGQNLPSVAVGAGYNYHNLLDNDRTFGMIFATVSVPISNWWGGSHAIKRKKIEYQKAVDEQRDKAQLLQIRMQSAWNNVVEAQLQLDIAQRSIEQAEENLRLHRDYYRAGTSKMSDLLEAQLLYQQSLDRRIDAFADYQNRLLDYRQAIGE